MTNGSDDRLELAEGGQLGPPSPSAEPSLFDELNACEAGCGTHPNCAEYRRLLRSMPDQRFFDLIHVALAERLEMVRPCDFLVDLDRRVIRPDLVFPALVPNR